MKVYLGKLERPHVATETPSHDGFYAREIIPFMAVIEVNELF